ncbi:MAG: alpha/beta hydrolase [Bacteroidetes bacterium]|nr:alpha/beta hydrolase [Bacteroidota bacterium]
MKRNILYTILSCLLSLSIHAQDKMKVYLIPGQGSDCRIYKNLQFDARFDTVHINYITPLPLESMTAYAHRLSVQIDTTETFCIIGVSLGGMLATEMTDFMHPKKVIVISSATDSTEIPALYQFFNKHPIHRYIPSSVFKYSTFIMQPLYEPDRKLERATCNAMIAEKEDVFIKYATEMIVSWKRTPEQNENKTIIHIHGSADNTLPIESIKADYIIPGGSHMMALTQADTISVIINKELLK